MSRLGPSITTACILAVGCAGGPDPDPDGDGETTSAPPELGAIDWGRQLEPALAASAANGKPVLLLFQEIPG